MPDRCAAAKSPAAEGFIVVKDALATADLVTTSRALEGLRDLRQLQGATPTRSIEDPVFSSSHAVCDEASIVDMVANSKVLPKVADILGWNICVYHAHVSINPPVHQSAGMPPPRLSFHRDSGRVNQELEVNSSATSRVHAFSCSCSALHNV
eukprot:SAG11_NODE_2402_length_3400_cov_4.019691_3_plen_152_part_00